MKSEDIGALEEALHHHFKSPELLKQALTHRSHAHENESRTGDGGEKRDNEQLEFLGDAVLGFVTSRELFHRFPEFSEGELSKLRAHLVSARHLAEIAAELNLGAFLRLGRGEEKSGGRSKSALLVNALEAILAALYLDGGLPRAEAFVVERIVQPELQRLQQTQGLRQVTDYKSALQEYLQAQQKPQPHYVVVHEEGPEHQKTFTVEARIHGSGRQQTEYVSRAQGSTKKKAEQLAAKRALDHLQSETETKDE